MKNRKLLTAVILLSSLLYINTGCQLFVNPEIDVPDGCAKISFAVPDLVNKTEARAVITPASLTSDDIDKFILSGEIDTPPAGGVEAKSKIVDKEFTSYTELQNDSEVLYFGDWKFTLKAYKGSQLVAQQVNKTENLNSDLTVNFKLSEAATGNGDYDLKVTFPINGAACVKYKVSTMANLSDITGQTEATVNTQGEGLGSRAYINVKENGKAKGYYFLRLFFYKDAAAANLISQNTVYFQVSPGCKTTGTVDLTDINTPYTITYKDNIDNDSTFSCWKAGAAPITEFNKSMKVILPTGGATGQVSRPGYTFEGWGYTPDTTAANAKTGWNPGDKSGNVTLYAIWTPKSYSITYQDYKGLSVSKNFSGTGLDSEGNALPSVHNYDTDTVLPVPVHTTPANATFVGWYKNAACTTPVTYKAGQFILDGDAVTTNTTLYAKWAFDHVYVGGTGEDSLNSGYDSTHPITDISEAFLLLKENNAEATIEMQKGIVISTDTTLSLSSEYSGARIHRASSYLDLLFNVETGAILTLENIIIDGDSNNGTASNAPAVGVHSGSTLNMKSSIIQNNNNTLDAAAASVHGGGVYLEGNLILDSTSSIKYNKTAYQGGGIYANGGSIKGGIIYSNTAVTEGGGIYVASDLSIEGKLYVTDNKQGIGAAAVNSNVLLPEVSGVLQKLIVKGPLTSSTIGITVQAVPGAGSTLIPFTVDYKTYNTGVTPQTYFVSDENVLIGADPQGEACLSVSSGVFAAGTYDNLKFYLCDGTGLAANSVSLVSTSITEDKTLYLVARLEDDSGATPVYTDISAKVTEWKVGVLLGQTDAETAGTGITIDQTTHSFTIPTGIRADNYAVFVSGVYNNRRYGTTIPLSIANYIECSLAELDAVMTGWANNMATGDCYIKLTDSAPDLYSSIETDVTLNSILIKPAYEYLSLIVDLSKCTGLTTLEAYSFYNCTNVKQITVPSSITQIGTYAFSGCVALSRLTIPDNPAFTKVGSYAFNACRILPSLKLPDSTTTIDTYAFYNCWKLDSMPLPASLTTLGTYAFSECKALREVEIPAGVTKLPAYVFEKCSKLVSVILNDGITEIGNYAFRGCSALTTIKPKGETSNKIPPSVTAIPMYCFSGCSSLAGIELTDQITSIGTYAFSASGITGIVIPDTVTSIGSFCFKEAKKLSSVTIGSGVTSLPGSCFSYCTALTTITIPNTVTTLGSSTFSYSGLTSITIPEFITSIPDSCFYSSSLESVTLPSSVIKINYRAFYYCSKLKTVTFTDDSYAQWQYTTSSTATTGTACGWTDKESVVKASKSIIDYSNYFVKVAP